MNFSALLTGVYCANPGRTLPNALWKTLAALDQRDTAFRVQDGMATRLEIWGEKALYLYWDRYSHELQVPATKLDDLQFALLHQAYMPGFPAGLLPQRTSYFRLVHDTRQLPPCELPHGFSPAPATVEEAPLMAAFINRCYPEGSLSATTVAGWAGHPAYDPALWLWIMHEATNTPAGLGIAEFDASIGEGSLEWIQVLPTYRRRGLGAALVAALLRRLAGQARFTTVSGQVDNLTGPYTLYRRSGFQGSDIWWVLRDG